MIVGLILHGRYRYAALCVLLFTNSHWDGQSVGMMSSAAPCCVGGYHDVYVHDYEKTLLGRKDR